MDEHGIRPLESKIAAIKDFPVPSSKTQLQRFLGMINFYRRFIPNCAELTLPLTNLLRLPKAKFAFTKEAEDSFEAIKSALAEITLLHHPEPNTQLAVMTDASTVAIGAVLQQFVNGEWRPLSFFSRKLKPAETRYSTFGRELLAIFLSIRHFRHMLEGRPFAVYTDHKPLTFALRTSSDKYSPREINQLDYISQFTSDIRYLQGSQNPVADALSRPAVNSITLASGIDLDRIALEQKNSDCQNWSNCFKLQDIPLPSSPGTILCDISTGNPRPLVPISMRRHVFDTLHGLSHPGIRATTKLITARFVWPHMHEDIHNWTKTCLQCQRSKVIQHTKSPIGTFACPDARFRHVHIDIVHLTPSRGFSYLLTCVDRYSRWFEAVPLKDLSAESVVSAFLHRWVATFGCPETITTNRGQQFESYPFKEMCNFLGAKRIRTTAYHPAANGMVERYHRPLKAAIRCIPNPANWYDQLPQILLGLRAAVKEDLSVSSFEMVFGTAPRLPGEMISTPPSGYSVSPDNVITRIREFLRLHPTVAPRQRLQTPVVHPALNTSTHVFVRVDSVRTPLQQPYEGPYKVLQRTDKHYTIDRDGHKYVVCIDRLKPAFLESQLLQNNPDSEVNEQPVDPVILQRTTPDKASPEVQPSRIPHTVTRSGRRVFYPVRFSP